MWAKSSSPSKVVRWKFHLIAAFLCPGKHLRSCQNIKFAFSPAALTQLGTAMTTSSCCCTMRKASLTSNAHSIKPFSNIMTINTFTIISGVVGLNVSSVEAHCPRNSLATILARLVQQPDRYLQSLTSFVQMKFLFNVNSFLDITNHIKLSQTLQLCEHCLLVQPCKFFSTNIGRTSFLIVKTTTLLLLWRNLKLRKFTIQPLIVHVPVPCLKRNVDLRFIFLVQLNLLGHLSHMTTARCWACRNFTCKCGTVHLGLLLFGLLLLSWIMVKLHKLCWTRWLLFCAPLWCFSFSHTLSHTNWKLEFGFSVSFLSCLNQFIHLRISESHSTTSFSLKFMWRNIGRVWQCPAFVGIHFLFCVFIWVFLGILEYCFTFRIMFSLHAMWWSMKNRNRMYCRSGGLKWCLCATLHIPWSNL